MQWSKGQTTIYKTVHTLFFYSYETGVIHGFSITVTPVLRGHPWDQEKVAL